MASSTSLSNTLAASHSVRRPRRVVSLARQSRAARSHEQPVTSRTRIPGKQSRSGMGSRWQPSGCMSGGRGGRWPCMAFQSASATRGSMASKASCCLWPEETEPEVLLLRAWLLQAWRCGMTSQTIRRVGSAAIERRRAKINAQIATLGLPLPGSLVERRTRCGNTGCHCHGDPPQLHGPYLIWTRKVDNKTVTRTLDTTQADALRPLMENSRRLRELTTELATLALQQVRNDPTQPDP